MAGTANTHYIEFVILLSLYIVPTTSGDLGVNTEGAMRSRVQFPVGEQNFLSWLWSGYTGWCVRVITLLWLSGTLLLLTLNRKTYQGYIELVIYYG